MCRSCEQGGRRCPSSKLTGEALAEHNLRRKRNRAVRSAAVSWARAHDVPDIAVSVLAYAPPHVARQWARNAGAPHDVTGLPLVPAKGTYRLRNASWLDAEMVDTIGAIARRQGVHPDERLLLDGTVLTEEAPDDEGVNETIRVMFDTGGEAYHKPFTGLDEEAAEDYGHDRPLQPVHEVAAWQLARGLGPQWERLVPPCVMHVVDDRIGSLSMGVDGQPSRQRRHVPEDVTERAGFFDALIAQQDRHSGNLLVDRGELHLIDHGFAFATPGDYLNCSVLQEARVRADPSLRAEEAAALTALLDSPDLLGLASYLEHPRAAALRVRARKMLSTRRVLRPGDYGEQ